jgi:hypothetical protein
MDGSGHVIPFRPRARPDTAPAAGDGQERLARALATLDAALLEQQGAVDRFRLAIGDLERAASGLEAGLVRYGDELACLGHDLERLAIEARALEAWADAALARPQP